MTLEGLFDRRALGIRLGLESLRAVHEVLDRPGTRVPAIHIVGTNGKGSVAAMAEAALRAHGKRVGLYTSPHLQRVTERVRIDGHEVSRPELEDAVNRVLAHESDAAPRPLSFFEVLTLAALVVFEQANLDVIVAEAGLGGRYDATRLVESKVVVITSIALDHQAWLGDTLEAIAGEKVAVCRPGVPVLTCEQPPEVMAVLQRHTERVGAPLRIVPPRPHAPLRGEHQRHNAALALAAVQPFTRATDDDLQGVRWAARGEEHSLHGGRVVFDAAHNLAAIEALVATFNPPMQVLFGCHDDKPADAMVAALSRLGPVHRVATLDDTRRLADVIQWLREGQDVLVCGSHRLVGAWQAALLDRAPVGSPDADPNDPR